MNVLNLGCGNDIRDGATNHDITRHRPEVDIVHDLNCLPWPFHDNHYHLIYCISLIEHLTITPIQALDECWRILNADGLLVLKYPLYTSPTIHDDPTHRWHLSERSIEYVLPGTEYGDKYGFYSPHKWTIVEQATYKAKTAWFKLRPLKP